MDSCGNIFITVGAEQCTLDTINDTVEGIDQLMQQHGFSPSAIAVSSNVLLEASLNVLKHNVAEMLPHAGYTVEIDPATKRCTLAHFGYILPKQKARMLNYFTRASTMSKEEIEASLAKAKGIDYPTVTGDISSGSGIRTQFADSEGKPELKFNPSDILIVTRRNGQKQVAERFTLTMDICRGMEIPLNVNLAHPTLDGRTTHVIQLGL